MHVCVAILERNSYKLFEAVKIDAVKSWVPWEFYYHKTHGPPCALLILQPGLHAINPLLVHFAEMLEPIGALFEEMMMRVVENNSKDNGSARALL